MSTSKRGTHLFAVVLITVFHLAFCHIAGAVTVAADGSGDYKTVQAAIDAAPAEKNQRFVVHIKAGAYREKLTVPLAKGPITFEGDDAATTILTYGDSARTLGANGQEIGTSKSASILIQAPDFRADNITFENSAGPVGQAVAVNVWSDRAVFRKCRFMGWQDTLLVNRNRQYFEDCLICGHVDFIFGASTAWFEGCELSCHGGGYVTAASTPQDHLFGLVFSHCRITSTPIVEGQKPFTSFLGRPWRPYASVIFLGTEMSAVVRAEGWSNWGNADNEKTARYGEYQSGGEGANPEGRVAWSRQLGVTEATAITPSAVFGGWNPSLSSAGGGLVLAAEQ